MKKHGGMIYDKNSKILDFSANIHPEGVPAEVKKAMMEALEASSYYPDPECGDLRYSIAEKEHVKMEHVICGNGAAELIFHLAFAVGAKTLLLPVPSFLEYEDAFLAASKGNLMIEKYQIDPVSFLIKEDLLDKMDASVDVLVLCQPNNPTGQLVEMNVMQRILDRAKEQNIVLLVDECFFGFCYRWKTIFRYSAVSGVSKCFYFKIIYENVRDSGDSSWIWYLFGYPVVKTASNFPAALECQSCGAGSRNCSLWHERI